MILSVIYWFFAVFLSALAVGGSLVVYHQYERLDNRPFFGALGMTAFAAVVAFFLPLDVSPFRILTWLLCSWLGMIGSAAMGRALYAGDDVPLVLVGLAWAVEAVAVGTRGAVIIRILVHGGVPWLISAVLVLFIVLTVRAVFRNLDGGEETLSEEGFVILAGGVVVITAAGIFLPGALAVYRMMIWIILLWLILFGLVFLFQDNRQKRLVGLVMTGAACCVAQWNPSFSWGIIAQVISWIVAGLMVSWFIFLWHYYMEHEDLCEDRESVILFCGLPLAAVVLLGLLLPGGGAFKFLIPLLCAWLFMTGGVFFFRGFLNHNWMETSAGFCFFQGTFAVALQRHYVLFLSMRLGWEGNVLVSWLVFNGVLAASLFFIFAGLRGHQMVCRVRDRDRERERGILTERAARLDPFGYHELTELSQNNFVRVLAQGVDITAIDVRVENRTRQVFKIRIAAGTYFIGTGRYQNMAARREEKFALPALDGYSCRLPVVCVNADRPIPTKNNAFLSVRPGPADLTRFLERSAREDPMVAQAGAWALTDHYTAAQIQARLKKGGSAAVSGQDILRAKNLLDELGIQHPLQGLC